MDDYDKYTDEFLLNICLIADDIESIGFSDKPPYTKIKDHLANC